MTTNQFNAKILPYKPRHRVRYLWTLSVFLGWFFCVRCLRNIDECYYNFHNYHWRILWFAIAVPSTNNFHIYVKSFDFYLLRRNEEMNEWRKRIGQLGNWTIGSGRSKERTQLEQESWKNSTRHEKLERIGLKPTKTIYRNNYLFDMWRRRRCVWDDQSAIPL